MNEILWISDAGIYQKTEFKWVVIDRFLKKVRKKKIAGQFSLHFYIKECINPTNLYVRVIGWDSVCTFSQYVSEKFNYNWAR